MRLPRHRCTICGYVYNPETDMGDPYRGIPPLTTFEKLPDDWVCPVCGALKSMFEKIEEV